MTLASLFNEKTLWALLAAALGIWSGYVTGQATTGMKLAQIEKDILKIELKMVDRHHFMDCTAKSIQRLADKSGQENVQLPCSMAVPE